MHQMMMEPRQRKVVTTLMAVVCLLGFVPNVSAQYKFCGTEYEEFHGVFHPLQHEALPAGDYARIRSRVKELVRLGKAIVKLGVPQNSFAPVEMRAGIMRFRKSVEEFRRAAGANSDVALNGAFKAVHDSFEELGVLSCEFPAHPPPVAVVDCPLKAEPGAIIEFKSFVSHRYRKTAWTWTLSGGTIVGPKDQSKIKVDTFDLAGTSLLARVEVDDGYGNLTMASCQTQVLAPGKPD